LIDEFGSCSNGASCLVTSQYAEAPCNFYKSSCLEFEEEFSDESILAKWFDLGLEVDLTKIARDQKDVKIFTWALTTEGAAVFTCDKNLLEICNIHGIVRRCFKSAIQELDEWLEGAIFNSNDFNIEIFSNSDDPFINLSICKHCRSHCGLGRRCRTFNQQY
jgi:hypothetical protein